MTTLEISKKLAQEISDEANSRGLQIEDFLREVLQQERTLANRHKIEQEQTWWLNLPLSERARYEGRYVAIHDKAVVDDDENQEALRRRIRTKYGNTAVLMIPAEGPREIRIYSPRLVNRIRLS